MTKGKTRKTATPADLGEDLVTEASTERASAKSSSITWDGMALRAAREQRGLAIEDMSSRTKINTAILRALEEERFEDTPKARVYVRGFVRCMAEEIGLDPDVVARSYVPRWERWFERTESDL